MTANPGDEREIPETTQRQRPIPADTFSARLVLARHFAGRLSIEQAATRADVNPEAWRRWEDGAKPRDKIEAAQAIADALEIDFNWLLLGGPLASSVRPSKMRKPSGGATVRKPTAPVRPGDGRPSTRPNGGRGPMDRSSGDRRRPVRISGPVAA